MTSLQQNPWIGQRGKMFDDRSGDILCRGKASFGLQFGKISFHNSITLSSTIECDSTDLGLHFVPGGE
jgi:hypothetical protein